MTNPYSILMDEEFRILNKTKELREKIVDNFIQEKGLPTKTGEMRVLNEFLNSLDSQTLGLVDKKLKKEENAIASDFKEQIKTILIELNNQKTVTRDDKVVGIDDKYIPDDIVPGETTIEYEELELDDFIKSDNQ